MGAYEVRACSAATTFPTLVPRGCPKTCLRALSEERLLAVPSHQRLPGSEEAATITKKEAFSSFRKYSSDDSIYQFVCFL